MKTDIKTDRPATLPITLMSQDKNNNQFILRFTNGGESVTLDASYTVEILTKFAKSGTSRLTTAKVRQDYATWEFDTAYITQDETVYNYVYVRKSGSLVVSADANCFVFSVDLSEIDKGAGKVAETYDENYEKYLDEFKDNVDFEEIAQAEQARKEAELLREENYEQKVDTAIVEADVVDKVDSKVSELAPQIDNLTAQLAQKLSQGEVSVFDIDKNKGLLDETYMSDTFKAQIAGTTAIGATPPDGSITLQKTTFYKTGSNFFNKNEISPDFFVSPNDGTLTAAGGFITSGYIPIEALTSYTIKNTRYYAFYDSDKVFISGVTVSPNPFTNVVVSTPANASYIRYSWSLSNETANTQQMNKGTTLYPYEDYKIFIDKKYVEKEDVTNLEYKSTNFVTIGKNLFNKDTVTSGFFVNQTDGTLASGAGYGSSEFIEVFPNTQYTRNVDQRTAFYDENKIFISGHYDPALKTNTLLSPANAKYMRCTVPMVNIDTFQVEKGNEATPYENYHYEFTYKKTDTNSNYAPAMVLPPKMYGLVGKEVNVYFDNILDVKANDYQLDVVYGASAGKQQNERWLFTPTVAGNHNFTINLYKDFNFIDGKSSTVVVKNANVGNGVTKKILMIGDSTTAHGQMITELANLFANDVMNMEFIGTKGTTVKHEAIAGWNTPMFYSDATSPFVFNGSFDFAQYMTTNGLSIPDYVTINLGINDTFSIATDGNIDTVISDMITMYNNMIASIKSYNSTIKFGIALTIPASANQDAYGHDGASDQTQWRYKQKNIKLVKALISAFKDREAENIYLVPININLDTIHNMATEQVAANSRNPTLITRQSNAVHPADTGYYQIADMFYYWLKSFEV